MATSEAAKAAGGFCYLDAAVTGLTGLAALVVGPRVTGVTKIIGAGALVWVGSSPTPHRVRVAAGLSAGLAALDLVNAFRPQVSGRRRAVRFAGAAYHVVFAIMFNEGARDV